MADDRLSGQTEFETLIARARAGEVSRADLILAFLDTMVVVPSGSDFDGGRGTLQPVQVERAGVTWMAVYTSLDGAKQVGHIAPYAVTLPGSTVIAGLAPGTGLVINPDGMGFELEPSLVAAIQRDQAQRRESRGR
jgi:SseB protein N-terminal domain